MTVMTKDPRLAAGFDSSKLEQIEQWRAAWREDESPLADGTLESGPFDDNQLISQACHFSRGRSGAELLHLLTCGFQPRTILELGTNLGISTAYFAAALAGLGKDGRVHTVDASLYRLRLAQLMHKSLDLLNITYYPGRFLSVLPQVLEEVDGIGLVFVDGQHDGRASRQIFDLIYPNTAATCLYLQNGIESSDAMRTMWNRLRADPRVYSSTTLPGLGLAVLVRNV